MSKENFVNILKHDDSISVFFSMGGEKLGQIADTAETLNEEAYMNGYGWDGFIKHYLAQKHSDILVGLRSDPEGSMYAGYYNEPTLENEQKAQQLANIIEELIDNENQIYEFIKAEGDNIEWD